MNLLTRYRDTLQALAAPDYLPVRWQGGLLAAIVLATLGMRLLTITGPSLDQTIWKEIDYLTISRNYYHHGYQFPYPEIDWPAEPPRATAMELPLVPYLAGLGYSVLGINVYSVRLVPLASWLLVVVYVFLLGRRETGPLAGLIAAAAAGFMPLLHQFRHVLFSEPLLIACAVGCIFHLAQWVQDGRRRDVVMAALEFSIAIALKLSPLYLLLPLSFVFVRARGVSFRSFLQFTAFTGVALVIPIVWYSWAYHLARNHIDVFGVFGGLSGGHDKFQSWSMISDLAWWEEMQSRFTWQILGGKGPVLLAMLGASGTLLLRRGGLLWAYAAAVFSYVVIVAEGHRDMIYRQLDAVPPLALFVGLGTLVPAAAVLALYDQWQRTEARLNLMRAAALILCFLGFAIGPIRNLNRLTTPDTVFGFEKKRWQAAPEVLKHVAPGAKIVAVGEYSMHNGGNDLSPVLFYYTQSTGWSLQAKDWSLEKVNACAAAGGEVLVAMEMHREPAAQDFLSALQARYVTLYQDKECLIVDLRRLQNEAASYSLSRSPASR